MAVIGAWNKPTQYSLTARFPKMPSWVEGIRSTINNLIDFLLGVLDLALAALEIVKAFAIGFLDPINAIIDAILAEVEQVLENLRKAGLYLAGDWYLAQPPFEDLRGGFAAYKTRMTARFTDTKDPSRPDLSDRIPVFAMFLYASVDFAGIHTLAQFLSQLVGFLNFNLRSTKTLQTPVDIRAQYSSVDGFLGVFENLAETFVRAGQAVNTQDITGGEALTLSSFSSAQVPDVAQLTWKLGGAPKKRPSLGLPGPPPAGFLIEVSTIREGLQVFYDRPLPNSAKVEGGSGTVQDREVGRVVTPEGVPLVLYGGADQVELDGIGYNDSMKDLGQVKDGAPRVFALRSAADNVPIPLELLKFGSVDLLQKTFFVSVLDIFGAMVALFNPDYFQEATYTKNLRFDEMPYNVDFEIGSDGKVEAKNPQRPQTFYARISTVSSNITRKDDFRYKLRDATADNPGKPLQAEYSTIQLNEGAGVQGSRGDRSEPSTVLEITFPSDSAKVYLQQLTAALAVLALSRADLEVGEEDTQLTFRSGKAKTATGLEPFAKLIPSILLATNPNDFYDLADEDTESSDVLTFRQSLLKGCSRVAADLYRKMGAQPGAESELFQGASSLLTFKWSDAINMDDNVNSYDETILGSLSDYTTVPGLARNPECAGQKLRRGIMLRNVGRKVTVKSREPGFYSQTLGELSTASLNFGGITMGSADRSPSLSVSARDGSTHIYFVRNIIPPEVYAAASQVLSFASGPALRPAEDGAWLSLRFGQLIPGFDLLLDMIVNWVRSLQLGASSIVDAILAYIDFLESRVLELQALLRRLDAIVQGLIPIRLPPVGALFLVGKGTTDILSQFLSAAEAPQDPATSYGGGAVLLAVGAPEFLINLFMEMFAL